jgi:signal transduction histidine kinase
MTIRNRLALFFASIAALMLLALATMVLTLATSNRKNEFFRTLQKEALTKANVLLNSRIDAATLQEIYRSNRSTLSEVEVAIYNTDFELVYHDAVDIDIVKETPDLLASIAAKGVVSYAQDAYEILGTVLRHQGKDYIITAAAIDEAGKAKLAFLYRAVVIVGFVLIVLAALLSRWVAGKALQPISAMAAKTKALGYGNMHLRLALPAQPDELYELATSFNHLLDRLEAALDNEKAFVSNAAHQLRTPLSTMLTRLQLVQPPQPCSEAALLAAVAHTIDDIQQYHRLITSLLQLSKAHGDATQISMQALRMDEVLLDAVQALQQQQAHYRIALDFAALALRDEPLHVWGNYDLLYNALLNVMDNACKFSPDNTAFINLSVLDDNIQLLCEDNGIGIDENLISKIFTPFVKGAHSNGTGIGLALAHKVVILHNGSIHVLNKEGGGAIVQIALPIYGQR